MRKRSVGNFVDEIILFFVKKYPWFHDVLMRSNNSLALDEKSLRHRVEQVIFKNSPLIAE